jgi:PKD repeat protein
VAYHKTDGAKLWETELPDSVPGASGAGQLAMLLTPVLVHGKLYVVAPNIDSGSPDVLASTLPQNVYQLNAADGKIDWYTVLDGIKVRMQGAVTFVQDAFAVGEHGLFCNGDSGTAGDGVPEVYAIKVKSNGAELAWAVDGGKVARSHVVYAAQSGILYAPTWADYGGTLYTYDPDTGAIATNTNNLGTDNQSSAHGFYDIGCLDFSGTDIIAGGFDGIVVRYSDQGDGVTTNVAAFNDDSAGFNWWGEYRVYGQLLRAPNGNSVLITGTNSRSDLDPTYSARVVAIDVTVGELLWEVASDSFADHGYTIRGGPYMGPDGKVYYFRTEDGVLVALKGPTTTPPTASFTAAPLSGKAPLEVSFDATASGAIASYAWSFGDGQTGTGKQTTHTYAGDGVFTVTLIVTDNIGLTATATVTVVVEKGGAQFKRGDANMDATVNIADAITVLGYLFGGGTTKLNCLDAANANDDAKLDIADAVKVLGHLFAQAGPLPEPFAACGIDPTAIGCEKFTPCGTGV